MNEVTDLAPFHIVPDWLLELPGEAHRVYAALVTFANTRTGRCDPSIPKIAERARRGETTVRKALRALEEAGAITITRRQSEAGDAGTSAYNLMPARVGREANQVVREANQGVVREANHHVEPDEGLEREGEADASPHLADRPDVEAICTALADHVALVTNRPAPRITEAWRRDARLMLDRDGVKLEAALRAIAWLGGPTEGGQFWSVNVLSPKKLRAQYPRLLARARQERGAAPRQANVFADALAQTERLAALG